MSLRLLLITGCIRVGDISAINTFQKDGVRLLGLPPRKAWTRCRPLNHGAGIAGFNDEGEAPNVTRELVRRGYTEEQIRQIWGGNFLRVFRRVEAFAAGK